MKAFSMCIPVIIISLAIWLLSAITLFADDNNNNFIKTQAYKKENKGVFSGSVQAGGLFMNRKSELHTDDKNKRLYDLNDPARSTDEILPLFYFDLNYTMVSGNSLYCGIPFEGEPRGTIGLTHPTRHGGSLNLALFHYLPEKVWKDPYIVGVDRQETDETRYGGKISYRRNKFELSYEHESVEIDDDEIASRLPDLKRDGIVHKISTSYGMDIGHDFMIKPGFTYSSADMDGSVNSYKGHKGGIALMKTSSSYMAELSLDTGIKEYDKKDPIFDKTRKDRTLEVMGTVSWLSPFGFEPFSLNVGAGYEKSDADIDFYDEETYSIFMTAGYQFGTHDTHGHHEGHVEPDKQ